MMSKRRILPGQRTFKLRFLLAFLVFTTITSVIHAQSFHHVNTVPAKRQTIKKPSSVAGDSKGLIYMAEASAGAIHVFDSTGVEKELITSIGSGNLFVILKEPTELYIDSKDNLYVYDASLGKLFIRTPDKQGQSIGQKGSELGMMGEVGGITVDSEGYIYLINKSRKQIDLYTPDGHFLTWIGSTSTTFSEPISIGINGKNDLYVLDKEGPSVFIYNVHGVLINTHRNLSRKQGISVAKSISMTVMPNGDFFLLDASSNSVTHFDQLANVLGALGTKGTSAPGVFENPVSIQKSYADKGNLLILDSGAGLCQLIMVNLSITAPGLPSGRMQLVPTDITRQSAWDLVADKKGNVYMIPFGNRKSVVGYKAQSDDQLFTVGGKFDDAVSLAIDINGNLLVLDRKAKEVFMFDVNGTFIKRFGKDIPVKLKDPVSITVQKSGNILVADQSTGHIHLWNEQGVYQRIVSRGDKSIIKNPFKIQTDSKEQIYVWDQKNNLIYRTASSGSPVAFKQLKARGEKANKDGVISGFYVDQLDQIHLFNQTTKQLEIYIWDAEPQLRFTVGKPGAGKYGFQNVDQIVFDQSEYKIYMPSEKGMKQNIFQLMLKPPRPDDQLKFDVIEDKFVVTVNASDSRAVLGYGLFIRRGQSEPILVSEATLPILPVVDGDFPDLELRHYCIGSKSYTGFSDLNEGFDDHLGYAIRLQAAGRYEEAFPAYQMALERMAQNQRVKDYIAKQLAAGGGELAAKKEVVRAMQFLKLAYTVAPENSTIQKDYAGGFAAMFKQYADRDELDAIILEVDRNKSNSNLKPIVFKAVEMLSAELSQKPSENSIQQAVTLQKKLVEWDNENPVYCRNLAASCLNLYKFKRQISGPAFEQENALREAEKYGKQAVSMLKRERKPYQEEQLMLADILNKEGKFVDAEKLIRNELDQAAVSSDNDLTIRYRKELAIAYHGQGKFDLAVLEYQRILKVTPDDRNIKILYSESLAASGKFDDARLVVQQLLINDRDNAELTARIGKIELQKKNYVEASYMLEKAANLDPSDKSIYGPLAEAFEGATNFKRAMDAYATAIQFQEQRLQFARSRFASENELYETKRLLVKYLMNLGRLYEQTGNYDEAIGTFNKVIAEDPGNAAAYYGLGKANISAGFLYDAEKALYTSCKLDPTEELFTSAHASALKQRDQLAKTQPPLTILDVVVKDIYPSLHRNYADIKLLSLGDLIVANNTGQPITPTSVTLYVREIMSQPTEIKSQALVGFSNNYIKLSALFSDKILSYTEDSKLAMDVEIKYNHAGQSKSAKKSVMVNLKGRNTISWYDKRSLGAFISPNVNELIDYNRKLDQAFQSQMNYGMNKPLLKAMQLYTYFSKSGFSYSPDPIRNFANVSINTELLDYIQYPAETIKRKSGDCDDLVALLCGMLENAGVATAYIDVPGHVFMAFDSQLRPDQLVENGFNAFDVIVLRNKVWIPIETTLMGKQDFTTAWSLGAKRYYDELTKGSLPELVSMADARNVYVPSSYVPSPWDESPLVTDPVMSEYRKVLAQLVSNTKKQVLVDLENRYLSEPENVFVKNKYANMLAQMNEYKKARNIMQEALLLSPTSAVVLNNMGNIYMLESNYEAAITYYEQASKIDPGDSEILINLCKAFLKSGDMKLAKSYFEKARTMNPDIDLYYNQLKSQIQ